MRIEGDVMNEQPRQDHTRGVPSTAAIHGHPIHPALIPLPIAFLIGAAVTDLLYWNAGSDFWARMSFWLITAGFVSGVFAGIAGLVDFLTIQRARAHKAGWIHMTGNVVVLVISFVNAALRIGSPTARIVPWGFTLSIVTAALLGITGWYGGELVFRHMIGVTGHGGADHGDHSNEPRNGDAPLNDHSILK